MGEIAEMMLDGTLCEGCGEYLGETVGFPMYCPSCAKTPVVELRKSKAKKVACRVCGKLVKKGQGVKDHLKDVHPGGTK